MIYVALLRGINVGGNNKVEMAKLRSAFERLGFEQVKTYINSGNIIFSDTTHIASELAPLIENVIEEDFGFHVYVVVRSSPQIKLITQALPSDWVHDKTMKCDVIFLWDNIDNKETLEQLTIKPGIDDVKYVPGAILWRVDYENATRSGVLKIVGTPLYKQMTVRNANTLRKLAELMS